MYSEYNLYFLVSFNEKEKDELLILLKNNQELKEKILNAYVSAVPKAYNFKTGVVEECDNHQLTNSKSAL